MTETVNHPPHYNTIPGVECIDVVRHMNFNRGNAMTNDDVINELQKDDEDINLSAVGLWLRGQPESDLKTVAVQLLRMGRSKQFYAERCHALTALAHTLPEPHQTVAYNILANGKAQP